MNDKKNKIMLILLSFQTGRNEEWCEKFIFGGSQPNSKFPVESSRNVARERARQAKVKYLNSYADKILSIVKE